MIADLQSIRMLFEPTLESMGYELVQVESGAQPGGAVLRVYIDAPGGIMLDDCTAVSRRLSALLDVEQPITSAYSLEVSSPGVDRPLVKPAHFQRFVGSSVRAVTHSHVLGRRRFSGRLLEANAEGVVVECEGEVYALPYDNIDSARLVPAF